MVFFSSLSRFGAFRGSRVSTRMNSLKVDKDTATHLIELLVRVLRVELGREHLERNDASDLQLSPRQTVLALRAPRLAYEWLYYFAQAHSSSSLREPPPDDLSRVRLEGDRAELPPVVFGI